MWLLLLALLRPPCMTLSVLLPATLHEVAVDVGFSEMAKCHPPSFSVKHSTPVLSHDNKSRHLMLVVLLKLLAVISLNTCFVFMEDNDISQIQAKG